MEELKNGYERLRKRLQRPPTRARRTNPGGSPEESAIGLTIKLRCWMNSARRWVILAVLVVMGGWGWTLAAAQHSATAPMSSAAFQPTVANSIPPPGPSPAGMVWIPGGEFSMGAQDPAEMHYAVRMQATSDSRPIHRVYVDGFWMDATEVTNEQFENFVKATGYVTIAERTPTQEDFPGAPPENLVAGSTVFSPPYACRSA